jgi:hypothetical protein
MQGDGRRHDRAPLPHARGRAPAGGEALRPAPDVRIDPRHNRCDGRGEGGRTGLTASLSSDGVSVAVAVAVRAIAVTR